MTISALSACKRASNPKPYAYFRITFPEHQYKQYVSDTCPFTFQMPVYTNISLAKDIEYHPCWFNINYPRYKAHVYITLRPVNKQIDSLLDDSHTLVYKHAIKADAIETQDFVNDSLKIYSTIFYIEGNAASPMQFHITDSVKYFVRGSVYFDVQPNSDSLAPAIRFVKDDVMHMIETFEWKKGTCNACF